MSEDRIYLIFAEQRVLSVDEGRGVEIFLESRSLAIEDDERVLEVWLP